MDDDNTIANSHEHTWDKDALKLNKGKYQDIFETESHPQRTYGNKGETKSTREHNN